VERALWERRIQEEGRTDVLSVVRCRTVYRCSFSLGCNNERFVVPVHADETGMFICTCGFNE
jgi:hypothetical protein